MAKLTVKNNYGVTPNRVLNDPNLTMKAKGLFGFIQSKPGGWDFSAERIAKQTRDGVKSIYSGLKELEDAGYLKRVQYKLEDGTWDWEYILTSSPFSVSRKTVDAFSADAKQADISKKDIVKKNSKKDNSNITAKAVPGQLNSMLGKTPLSRLKTAYEQIYQAEFDHKPRVFLNGKDGGVLKSLLKDYNEYQIVLILLEYFDSRDKQVRDAAFPLAWVTTRLNKLLVGIEKDCNLSSLTEVKKIVNESMKNL